MGQFALDFLDFREQLSDLNKYFVFKLHRKTKKNIAENDLTMDILNSNQQIDGSLD